MSYSNNNVWQHQPQLLKEVVTNALCSIVICINERIVYANEASFDLYGRSMVQLLNADINSILQYEQQGKFIALDASITARTRQRLRVTHPSGNEKDLLASITSIRWADDPAICISSINAGTSQHSGSLIEDKRSLLMQAIMQSPEGLVISNAQERGFPTIFANSTFYEITGFTEKEVVGNSCRMLQGEQTSADTLHELSSNLKAGRGFRGEILNYRKDGSPFWNRLSISPVTDSAGKLTHFISSQSDVTANKTSKQTLDLLQQAMDQLTERVTILDMEDRYLYINNTVADLVGISKEQARGKHFSDVVSKEFYRNNLREFLEESRKGVRIQKLYDQDAVLGRSDDSDTNPQRPKRYVEYSSSPIKNDKDEIAGVVVISQDKSDEVNAQKALLQSESRLRDFVDIATDWYWEADQAGTFTFISPDMKKFIDQHHSQSITSLADLCRAAHSGSELKSVADVIADPKSFSGELMFHTDAGRSVLNMQIEGRPTPGDEQSDQGFRGIGTDLTVQRRMERDLRHLAMVDELTGLLNRREFERKLSLLLSEKKSSEASICLMYIDVDRLKLVNDTLGHAVGDDLIRQVARVLRESIMGLDSFAARIGGDEFVVVTIDVSPHEVESIASKIISEVEILYLCDKQEELRAGLSVGILNIESSSMRAEEAVAKADLACYRVKDRGGNGIAVYQHQDHEYEQRMEVNQQRRDIRAALDNDGFELYLQPIVKLEDGKVSVYSYEVLLRMYDGSGALLSPFHFIHAAEVHGFIDEVDRWVVKNAIQILANHKKDTVFSINLSGRTLADADLAEYILSEIVSNGIEGHQLTFEITETAAMAQIDNVQRLIEVLGQLGCRFVLDDFGSGLSSFKYLSDFDVSGIKVDGSFVKNMTEKETSAMIVSSMTTLARNLDLTVVAEWTEDLQTVCQLRDMGVFLYQGYYFAKPAPALESLNTDFNWPTIGPTTPVSDALGLTKTA